MTDKSLWEKIKDNQVTKFILSAGAGFLVDISAFYMFFHHLFKKQTYDLFGYDISNYTLSLSISFFLGVMVNFLMTRYIVFQESKLPAYKQFFRFIGVAIVGFFANLLVLKLFIKYLHLDPPVARIVAALSLFFASYFVHKVFSFSLSLRHHATPSGHKSSR